MSLHRRRTHPEAVPGCFGCHVSTVQIAHSSNFSHLKEKEKVLDKDLDAYKRLRRDGLQPEGVTGSATLEARADHKLDVEMSSSPFIKHMNADQKAQFTAATA